ncbi:MAG: SCO family protein [Leptospiraceae bacterium]|nr:SCO family protein [Leptospiraceae bacterium]MCP5513286.1 SCO family protein [Leptospiraceae bacterium]
MQMFRYLKKLIPFLLLVPALLLSYDPEHEKKINKTPSEIEGLDLVVNLGETVPLDIPFVDEEGKDILLSDYFESKKPVVLTMVYYKCPTLCNFHLNGLNQVFKDMDWNLGKDYQFVAVSIEPTETPDVSNPKKSAYWQDYLKSGKRDTNVNGMHFLTGKEENIKKLASVLGFKYRWNPGNKQWIHPAVAYVLTPGGKISRFFNGISFQERDLRLALVEAGGGKIGTIADQFALFCFQFDPTKNKYTLYAYNLMKLGGGITVLFVGAFLLIFWRKENRNHLDTKE